MQQKPWCYVVFCRLQRQFCWVMGVCRSKNARPLLSFVIFGRTSRRHHCGPIRPYHWVCIGWLYLGVLQGSWEVGWFSSPYWMWQKIVQRQWCWGRLKLWCQQQSHNIKMCLQFFVLDWCRQNLKGVYHWWVICIEPSDHSLVKFVFVENFLDYLNRLDEHFGDLVETCVMLWWHILAYISQHIRRCSSNPMCFQCTSMRPNP